MNRKMNKIYLTCLALLILALGSCNDVLDQAPDGTVSYDEIFADHNKTGAFLNTCYEMIPVMGTRYFFWSRGPVVWSDEAWDTDAEAESTLSSGRYYNGDASAANHPLTNISDDAGNGDYWNRYWVAIRNCTFFLTRINDAKVNTEEERSRWKAEAHILRAYYYSELLRWFGTGLPIQRELYDMYQDFSNVKKDSYYDVVQFIIEDCNEALNSPNLPWRITASGESSRVTKAVAEAIKSRMILYGASPLYNEGQNYWEEAYTINKKALENLKSNGYALYNKVNYPQTYMVPEAFIPNEKAAMFNEYFTQSVQYSATAIDRETIYQQKDGQGNIWHIDGIGSQSGYKTGTCPSQELVDSYETINGETILNLASPYKDEKHLEPNYNTKNTLYDPANPYENRDPRFYASIYYNGSKRTAYWGFAETPDSPENYPAPAGYRARSIMTYVGEPKTGIDERDRAKTRTGYYGRKFLHPFAGDNNPVGGANWKTFRLAEIILNFAEAAAEANHKDEALAALNEIRTRAGMPSIPNSISLDDLKLRIKHERRVELAMEGFRYFDVRRWSAPTGDLSKTDKWITAAEITRTADGKYKYGRKTVRAKARACYTNKFLRLPIPLDEVNRMLAISGEDWQNEGW